MRRRLGSFLLGVLALPALLSEARAEDKLKAALAQCTPGQLLETCRAALTQAGVKHEATPTKEPLRLWVPLSGAYLAVDIETAEGAAGRISLVDFQSELPTGAPRRELVRFLRGQLPGTREVAAQGNIGCGASGGGPAWILKGQAAGTPAVQLAIDAHSSIRGGAGKPLEVTLIETRTQPVHLCFLLPAGSQEVPGAAGAMAAFLRTDLLAAGGPKPRPAR